MSENKSVFTPPARDTRPLSERILDAVDIEPGLTISKLVSYLRETRTNVVKTVTRLVISHELVCMNADPGSTSPELRYAKPKDAENMIVNGEAARTDDWKPGEKSRPALRSVPPSAAAPTPVTDPTPAPVSKVAEPPPAPAKATRGFVPPSAPARPSAATFDQPVEPAPVVEPVVEPVEVVKAMDTLPAVPFRVMTHVERRAAITADLKAHPGTDSVACAARIEQDKQRVCGDLLVMLNLGTVRRERMRDRRGKIFAWFHAEPVVAPAVPVVQVVLTPAQVIDMTTAPSHTPSRKGLADVSRALKGKPKVEAVDVPTFFTGGPIPPDPMIAPPAPSPTTTATTEPELALEPVAAPVEVQDEAPPVVEAPAKAPHVDREPYFSAEPDNDCDDGAAKPDAPEPHPRSMIITALDALMDDMITDGWQAIRLIAGSRRGLSAIKQCERILAAMRELELVRGEP